MEPLVTRERSWVCPVCQIGCRVPCHLAVGLQPTDTWSALSALVTTDCSNCGSTYPHVRAIVLIEGMDQAEGPAYLLVPGRGTPTTPTVEDGVRFLRRQQLAQELLTGLLSV